MPSPKPDYVIPPERIRGYATLAPEYAQNAVNVVANFCQSAMEGLAPQISLAEELKARMSREQIKAELAAVFDKVGARPRDYDFERVILVLCDDSVRTEGLEEFGWPDFIPPTKRRVIIEFVWHFPAPVSEPLPCTFWLSSDPPGLGVCKFVHERMPF